MALAICAALGVSCNAVAAGAFSADSKWMTGDWGGLRSELLEKGIDIQAGYTGEAAANLHGGYSNNHTTRYADQFTLGTAIDLQKLAGWNDTQFMVQLTNRNGSSLNDKNISDPRAGSFSYIQEVYGTGSVTRLSELWLSKGFFDSALNVKVGRFSFGDEFGVEDCLFQNLAFCGPQTGNWVDVTYNSPLSTWAARIKYKFNDQVYAQIGAYNINPNYADNNNALKLRTSGTEGTLVPVEVVWTPTVNELPGEYHVGYYYSSANADDLYKDSNNHVAALTGEDYRSDTSRHGWWVTGKQQLTTLDGDAARGLTVYADVAAYDEATTAIANYQKVALVLKGPFASRPDDSIGFAVARLESSKQSLRNAKATNVASGITEYDDPDYLPEQRTEYNYELNYGFQLTQWLNVRPNLQYIVHPGGVNEVQNAFVAGLQVQSVF